MTIFHWEDDNVQHEVPVQMGKEKKFADIVLKRDDFGIVIEMKAPGIGLGHDEALQISSYMRNLGYKYGLLVGKIIQVFYEDDRTMKMIREIEYTPNNEDGIEMGSILDSAVCSNEELQKFISARIKGAVIIEPGKITDSKSKKSQNITPARIKKLREIGNMFNREGLDVSDVSMGIYPYIHILNQNWPRHLHYEFTSRDEDHVGIELHYENRNSWEGSGARKTFDSCCSDIIIDNKHEIKHTPRNAHGICIQVSSKEDSKEIAALMNIFIDKTIGKINKDVTL